MLPAAEEHPAFAVALERVFGPRFGDLRGGGVPPGPLDEFVAAAGAETPLGVEVIGLPVGHDVVGGVLLHDQVFDEGDHLLTEVTPLAVDLHRADLPGVRLAVDELELGGIRPGILADAEPVADVVVAPVTDDAELLEFGAEVAQRPVDAGKSAFAVELRGHFGHFALKTESHPDHGRGAEVRRTAGMNGGDDLEIKGVGLPLPRPLEQPVTQGVAFRPGLEPGSFGHDHRRVHLEEFPGEGEGRQILQFEEDRGGAVGVLGPAAERDEFPAAQRLEAGGQDEFQQHVFPRGGIFRSEGEIDHGGEPLAHGVDVVHEPLGRGPDFDLVFGLRRRQGDVIQKRGPRTVQGGADVKSLRPRGSPEGEGAFGPFGGEGVALDPVLLEGDQPGGPRRVGAQGRVQDHQRRGAVGGQMLPPHLEAQFPDGLLLRFRDEHLLHDPVGDHDLGGEVVHLHRRFQPEAEFPFGRVVGGNLPGAQSLDLLRVGGLAVDIDAAPPGAPASALGDHGPRLFETAVDEQIALPGAGRRRLGGELLEVEGGAAGGKHVGTKAASQQRAAEQDKKLFHDRSFSLIRKLTRHRWGASSAARGARRCRCPPRGSWSRRASCPAR